MILTPTITFGPQLQARLKEAPEIRETLAFIQAMELFKQILLIDPTRDALRQNSELVSQTVLLPGWDRLLPALERAEQMDFTLEFTPIDEHRNRLRVQVSLLLGLENIFAFIFDYNPNGGLWHHEIVATR